MRLGRLTESGLYSYHALAGEGSETFHALSGSRSWCAALLGTVAGGALWLMALRPAQAGPDGCTTVGTTATCTSDQSDGIGTGDFNQSTVDTLNVNSLTTDITPASGTDGIFFKRTGAGDTITINSDIPPYFISVTGAGADGILAYANGNVTINHSGDITSANKYGILAYSSPSGGTVSVTSSGNITASSDAIGAQSVGIATNAGDVTVKHYSGTITSYTGRGIGASSNGIGGGSGNASVINSGNIYAHGDGIYARTVESTSDYRKVTVTSTGDITSNAGRGIYAFLYGGSGAVSVASNGTISAYSDGIFAQVAGGATGDVTVNSTGDITTTNPFVKGIYVLSSSGVISVTSSGNISGEGFGIAAVSSSGAVSVTSGGDISSNENAGIYAISSSGTSVTSTGNISTKLVGIYAHSSNGIVSVTSTGDISSNENAGIVAMSYSGTSVTSAGNISTKLVDIYAHSSNGIVSVTSTGDITSSSGRGIDAGVGFSGAVSVTSSGNISAYNSGISARVNFIGDLSVNSTGDITSSTGDGILAFGSFSFVSVTSKGAISAYNDGVYARSGFDVAVDSTGDITANSSGIYAKSIAGDIDISVSGGTTYGGSFGIKLYGGSTNTVTIASGATVTGGTDAILGDSGDDSVNNFGTVIGNVDLGTGTNAFNNLAGGLFNSGTTVNLGAGNALTNSGTLAPGGIGTIQTTITGNFVQTASGRLAVDVSAPATSDLLAVSGTAMVAGKVEPKLVGAVATGNTVTILTATSVTNNGLTVQNPAATQFQLIIDPTDIMLVVGPTNFVVAGLTPNETAIAQDLQSALNAGGGNLNTLLNFLAGVSFLQLADALDHLSPESYLTETEASLFGELNFGNSLFSCPLPAHGGQSLMGEGGCYWLRPSGHIADYSPQTGYFGFNEKAGGLTGGVQGELAPNWYLDLGFGYERSTIDVDNNLASANGNVLDGGAALKYIRDNWLVAGSVSGSFARYDTSRYGVPTAGTATAQADNDTLDFRLRFAYAFGSEAFYVKPLVDFDAIGLWRGAINESGAGALDLHVQSQNDWLASAAPGLEVGTQWHQGGYTWRPYVRAGVRFLSQDSLSATASFAGSPVGVAPFTVTTPLDQTAAEVSAGCDVWQNSRFSLRIAYDGRFGAHTKANGGELELHEAF